jgi:dienelactone hydrolase
MIGSGRRRSLIVTIVAVLLSASAAAVTASGAAATRGARARFVLSDTDVMVDDQVGIAVTGLAPGTKVVVRLSLDRSDGRWVSKAVFRANVHGRVDLATTAPLHGDYSGVDPMGFFWSARLVSTEPATPDRWTEFDTLTARVNGHKIASADLVRHYLRPGVRVTPVRELGLVGTLFVPRGTGPRPTLIVVGGSQPPGGFPMGALFIEEQVGAAYASHGYTVLALAYFDASGTFAQLPRDLSLIPLEYFRKAIAWLKLQPSVDPLRIGISGASRGAELALLLASRDPDIKSVVAVAPSSVVWSGIPQFTQSAWTDGGQPVPFLVPKIEANTSGFDWYKNALEDPAADPAAVIPVEHINGAVMLVSGENDQVWPSGEMAGRIMDRLGDQNFAFVATSRTYPGMGHVFYAPYQPVSQLGADAPGTAAAGRIGWPRILHFLHQNLARRSPA